MRKIYFLFSVLFLYCSGSLFAQHNAAKLHSHNDYLQTIPFWEAYANGLESIEADVILLDGKLFVAHEKESMQEHRTLQSLYLDPIRTAYRLDLGTSKEIQLLIDIKTEPYATLGKLEKVLAAYQDLWDGTYADAQVKIVISGNRPKPEDYERYPEFIHFDYQSVTETDNLPLQKIALISLNFRKLSAWNGNDALDKGELTAIKQAIQVAHNLGRPIRFWATPDTETAWSTLIDLGVDYINTDMPYPARAFLNHLQR